MEPTVGDLSVASAIIIVTALVWIVWDVIAYLKDYTTFSSVITRFSWYSPAIPFAAGFLAGHFFW